MLLNPSFFFLFSPFFPYFFLLWSPEEIIYNIQPPSPTENSEELGVAQDAIPATSSYDQRRRRLTSLSLQKNTVDNGGSGRGTGAASPHSAPIRLSASPSPSQFLRTPTLGGKWIWKSVEKGDSNLSGSGYKLHQSFFLHIEVLNFSNFFD